MNDITSDREDWQQRKNHMIADKEDSKRFGSLLCYTSFFRKLIFVIEDNL